MVLAMARIPDHSRKSEDRDDLLVVATQRLAQLLAMHVVREGFLGTSNPEKGNDDAKDPKTL